MRNRPYPEVEYPAENRVTALLPLLEKNMGNLFVWDPARYSLHIGPMDDDHRKIIASMNKLHELHDAHAGQGALARTLAELIAITMKHFSDEETYMEKVRFPDVGKHRLIHKSLLDKMYEHKRHFEANGELTDEFFSFLSFWLKSHICGIDMKYSEFSRLPKSA